MSIVFVLRNLENQQVKFIEFQPMKLLT